MNFENDDDAEQELGKDSRLMFRAPAEGDYFVEIKDARSFQGPDFKYEFSVRRPSPSFAIKKVHGAAIKVAPGGFKKIGIEIDRTDGFDGSVDISIEGLPEGFSIAGPTTIESGQLQAWFALHADEEAVTPADDAKQPILLAVAQCGDREIRDSQLINSIVLEEKVQLHVKLAGNSNLDSAFLSLKFGPEKPHQQN